LLASLLPGIRELRTPLAIGYLWLINAWILFAEDLPKTRPQDGELVAAIWDLAAAVGITATLAAVTFGAFIIGSILEVDPQGSIVQLLTPIFFPRTFQDDRRKTGKGKFQFEYRLLPVNTTKDLSKYIEDEKRGDTTESGDTTFWLVMSELPQIATRLQVANSEVYGRYDRLFAEASVRINLAIPLVVLLMLLIWQAHLDAWQRLSLTAAALGVGYLMARKGFTKIVAARDVVIQALISVDEVRSRRLDERTTKSSWEPD
jgi:hypothetical protein